MSPTKIYVVFWVVIMLISWGIGLGVIYQLSRLTEVLLKLVK